MMSFSDLTVEHLLIAAGAIALCVFLWRRRNRPLVPFYAALETPLLQIGRRDRFTLRDAFEGIAIFGGTGSGKTSSSGLALAQAYLRSGMGGIVCCAKPDEASRWVRLANANGRGGDVIVFDHTGTHRFNFLDYAQVTMTSGGFENNLVQLLARIADAARAQSRQTSDNGENAFFKDAATQLVANALPLLAAVHGTIRLKNLYQFVTSAPVSREQASDQAWQLNSFCAHTLARAAHLAESGDRRAERAFEEHADYWLYEFSGLGDRTRGTIVTTLTSSLYPFLSGKLQELFCTDTTFAPAEFTREGAIIILALPTRSFGPAGAVAQQIVKLLWQMALESEPATERTRPVFCWADEAQFFMNSYDTEHLSVCRQSRVANVFITQDLPTYYAQMGDESGAKALVAKFQTRIFHANTDMETNRYASEIVGNATHYNTSDNWSDGRNSGVGGNVGEDAGGWSGGSGLNRGRARSLTSYQGLVLKPEFFGNKLRTGGRTHGFRCDAILLRSAGLFRATKSNWIKAEFMQR